MLFTLSLLLLLQSLGINAGSEHDISLRGTDRPLAFRNAVEIIPRAIPAACTYVLDALEYCAAVSPSFLFMAPSKQAPCLCYSSTVWQPSVLDNAVSTCASYASTADPVDYSAIADFQGFCSSVGDVSPANTLATTTRPAASTVPPTSSNRASSGTTPSSASASGAAGSVTASAVITPAPTSTINAGCSTVYFALSYCSSISPGFLYMDASSQAPCLCYSSTSWDPGFFDSAVQTCADYAQTANPSDYSDISSLENFCTSVGDVLGGTTALTNTGGLGAVLTGGPQSGSTSTNVASSHSAAGGGGAVTVTAVATSARPSSNFGQNLMVNWALALGTIACSMFVFF